MSVQYYTLSTNRIFSAAQQNMYIHGIPHHDRILQEHDFVYMLSGSWDIYQNDTLYSVKEGDVILLHGGIHHYGLTPCSAGTRTMYLHFNIDPGDLFLPEDTNGDPFIPTDTDSPHPQTASPSALSVPLQTVISCGSNEKVKSLFADIIYALETKTFGYETRLDALFSLLLLELHSCLLTDNSKHDDIVEEIIRLFQSNPEKNYTLEQLSELFFVSEKTLCRRFMKSCGKSPSVYQNDLKLEWVHRSLTENPSTTLRQVALNYGFYDEFHLSKAFKQKYGVSPRNLI